MTPTRKKRLAVVALILVGVGTAAAVAFTALNDNMLYFVSPTDVHANMAPPDKQIRLGGLVAAGSVERDQDSLAVYFTVTDGRHDVPVSFEGILPDLFREGQGVIAHGSLDESGHFHAHEVLARHDETYMPPEVMRSLEEAGHPAEASGR
ncbi:cytochrome c maturation protein CcmE [Wenzhouxiangella sp. XN201]|uniref:cytochrome c maturation protein CcmE n=1 Tax=Wenzhouxiangella sp. XN201 TaxID=2710755 RepID=UPI0013C8647B|nr:cytochrome c maturation protein CcmE [Wenzhouxiangella sp. XN201]NEZ03610.1 cytochrome c maturation protein CcmE [Wenzhouxiangella sp. XN201]